jgi:hypothetical protein
VVPEARENVGVGVVPSTAIVIVSEATDEGVILESTARASTVVVAEIESGVEYFVEEVVGAEPFRV